MPARSKKAAPEVVPDPSDLATREVTATTWHVSPRTVDDWRAKGLIKSYRLGGRVLIDQASVRALLKPSDGAA